MDLSKLLGRSPSAVSDRLRLAQRVADLDFQHWAELSEKLAIDPSSRVRAATARSVAFSPGSTPHKLLEKLAADGVWKVRREVAVACGSEPEPDSLLILLGLVKDKNAEVREAALRSLLRLKNLKPNLFGASKTKKKPPQAELGSVLGKMFGAPSETRSSSNPWLRPATSIDMGGSFEAAGPPAGASQAQDDPPLPRKTRAPESPPPERVVNTWFQGHSLDQPLAYREEYTLCLQVSPEMRVGSHTQGDPRFKEPPSTTPTIDVVVALVTDDFDILGPAAKRMKLPTDRSQNSPLVDFRVRPRKNNQEVFIHVLFFSSNALFHEAQLGARAVHGAPKATGNSSAVSPAETRYQAEPGRYVDANLQVVPMDQDQGYRIVLFSDDGGPNPEIFTCFVSTNPDQIARLLMSLRKEIDAVVDLEGEGVPEFLHAKREAKQLPQPHQVSEATLKRALERLVGVARRIDVALFDSELDKDRRERALALRRRLRELSRGRKLHLQILSAEVSVPWNFMYDGGAEPDADYFWGFRHIVEELPYRVQPSNTDTLHLEGEPFLGLNLNHADFKDVLIQPQLASFAKSSAGRTVVKRTQEDEVLNLFSENGTPGRIEYFYCHAGAAGSRQDGYGQSYLGITSHNSGVTLEDIRRNTFGFRFPDHPVFVLNACESVQMDGRFYDGFAPRLLAMGAAAVIGTECKVPQVLGAHLGTRLVQGLLSGETVGEALFTARKAFFAQCGNPFGLLYRSFGNSDVRLALNPQLESSNVEMNRRKT